MAHMGVVGLVRSGAGWLCRGLFRRAMRCTVRERGFPVESGSVAERVMRAAVEELPDDARRREALFAARSKQKSPDDKPGGSSIGVTLAQQLAPPHCES